jgi:Rps23 Pro-64 3,4-dihydroxylase Tpa1-like proline 4-hydroxylase
MINRNIDFFLLKEKFLTAEPFNHVVIDNFFEPEVAKNIAEYFPAHDSPAWTVSYNNPIEVKKASSHWDKFPKPVYAALYYLCSNDFISKLNLLTGNKKIYADYGLHGGGMHSHSAGGKLNIHQDYSIHPKVPYKRNYNLIVYMTPDWDPAWGGSLSFWSHDETTKKAKDCVKKVDNVFNRAVIFDTTQNSWHGLPETITCPDNLARRSLAVYYISDIDANTNPRGRAYFVPHAEQKNDPSIVEFCENRSK